MTKADLRREMRTRLQAISAEREERSRAICRAIAAHPAFLRSGIIALFDPLPIEPDVSELFRVATGRCCFPRVAGEAMEFARVSEYAELLLSPWHKTIREPSAAVAAISPDDIGLILVPGLAFARDGHRLGRGGGYYDRYLARLPASTIKLGVCFELQVVETLPTQPHDRPVDAIVTENGLGPSL